MFIKRHNQESEKKNNPQNTRKCVQITDHIFGKYPECIQNPYTLQTKRETQLNIDNGLEEIFLQKTFANDQQAHQNLLSAISHWGNAIQTTQNTTSHQLGQTTIK